MLWGLRNWKNTNNIVNKTLKYVEPDRKQSFTGVALAKRYYIVLRVNPIAYRGGGGVGLDHQIIDHNSKTALYSTSKLGDFDFLSIRQIFAEMRTFDSPAVFEMRSLKN